MRVLKLLARVAFLCNICFILSSLFLWLPHPPEGQLVSTVVVMGYLMGLPVNVVVFGWMLVLLAKGKWGAGVAPGWLLIFNSIIFCFQIIYLISRL
jgi:hypothetical protein